MHVRILKGRPFDAADGRAAPPVTIVNEAMAKRFWPNVDPLGQRVRFGTGTQKQWATVVGVIADGVRAALGAQQHRIVAMVVVGGARMAVIGIVIGAVDAVAASRSLQALLFGVTTGDPPVYVGPAGVLVLLALIASAIPARRAAGVDPLIALRGD